MTDSDRGHDTPIMGSPRFHAASSAAAPSPLADETGGSADPTPVAADAADPSEPTPPSGRPRRSNPFVLGGLAVGVAGLLGLGVVLATGDGGESVPPPKPDIPLDAWAPYWTLDDSVPNADIRIPSMREISPFWFEAQGVDTIAVSEFTDADLAAAFMDAADDSGAAIVPSIVDALPAGGMAAILADPDTRTRHVDAIVEFATEGDYDGIDLDYEQFAFADGRDTWEATRPNWIAFVEELSGRLTADGRTLTVSIPPIYDTERTDASGFWVYDHGAIAPHVDFIRVMAYDFSVGEPGPIAPMSFVERSIDGVVAATGDPDKVVLGLAAYGRNWPIATTGACPTGEDVPGVTTVTTRTVDDLIDRRDATPIADPMTGEWSFTYDLEISDGAATCTQTRQVHYVDADGIRLRMDLAREKQLGGVALWAFGFDDDDVWEAILPTVDASDATPTS